MEPGPAELFEYYRRAAEIANREWRRQGPDDPSGSTSESSASVISTSSVASVSSTSTASTSTRTSTSTSTTSTSISTSTSLSSLLTSAPSTESSTIMTTDSAGNTVTTTIVVVPTNTPSQTPSQKSSTNTGAIVGGVVGGIAAIVILAVVIWLIRRKRKPDKFEANIFDPDRNVEHPHSIGHGHGVDLAAGAAGAGAGAAVAATERDGASNITPYYAPSSTAPTSTHPGSSVYGQPEMQQAQSPISSGYYSDYGHSAAYPNYQNYNQYQAMPSIAVGEPFPNPYAPGYHPAAAAGYGTAAAAGLGAAAGAGLSRGQTATSTSSGYPPTSPIYSQTSEGRNSPSASPPVGGNATLAPAAAAAPLTARQVKEREAFGGRSNYSVANPVDPAAAPVAAPRNPSPTPSRGSATGNPASPIVHQDAGRVPDDGDVDESAEIPPTYDSIPRDNR